MKQSIAAALVVMTALLCACAAQPQWETVEDGCTQAATGEPGVIYVHLPADAVEEVFSERGAQHVYAAGRRLRDHGADHARGTLRRDRAAAVRL